jgi:hypothetical protein
MNTADKLTPFRDAADKAFWARICHPEIDSPLPNPAKYHLTTPTELWAAKKVLEEEQKKRRQPF